MEERSKWPTTLYLRSQRPITCIYQPYSCTKVVSKIQTSICPCHGNLAHIIMLMSNTNRYSPTSSMDHLTALCETDLQGPKEKKMQATCNAATTIYELTSPFHREQVIEAIRMPSVMIFNPLSLLGSWMRTAPEVDLHVSTMESNLLRWWNNLPKHNGKCNEINEITIAATW